MSGAAGLLMALLALGHAAHARVLAVRAPLTQAKPRAIALDIRGPAQDAAALRATLQELTTRRGLPLSFEAGGDDRTSRAVEPWATLSVDLGSDGASSGPALTLREGTTGRVRLQRVVPGGASHQVMIETLATIAYTALETLAIEDVARERSSPRQRTGTSPARERAEQTSMEPTAEPPAGASDAPAAPALPAQPPPEDFASTKQDTESLTLSSYASPPSSPEKAPALPVRLSLASFAGYRAGNLFTGDRRTGNDAWGMGIAAAVTVPRWPLQPALGLGLGAWYGTSPAPATDDGSPRTPSGTRWQGQADIRLTVLRLGRLGASLGPWLTISRASYPFGGAPTGGRGPVPDQSPSSQGPGPNANDTPSLVTRTEFSAGLAARFEAALGGRLAVYCTLAGAAPLTARVPAGNRQGPGGTGNGGDVPLDTGMRWTLSALAGLSVDLTGPPAAF